MIAEKSVTMCTYLVKLVNIYFGSLFYIQCVPEKRKRIFQVNFLKTIMIYQQKVYIVAQFGLSSFF